MKVTTRLLLLLLPLGVYGQVWERVSPPLECARYEHVCFLDSLHGWILGEQESLVTRDGGVTWETYEREPTPRAIQGMDFADAQHGMAAAGAALLRTFDGGQTWESCAPAPGEGDFEDVRCFRGGRACAVGSGNFAGPWRGIIMTTGDNGWNWTVRDTSAHQLCALDFYGAQRGWAAGWGGVILHTADGGLTWQVQRPETPQLGLVDCDLVALDSLNVMVTFQRSGDASLGFRTRNGGQTWTTFYVDSTQVGLLQLSFADPLHGWALDTQRGAYRTNNGGTSWQRQPVLDRASFLSIAAGGRERATVIGRSSEGRWCGVILGTEDSGADWRLRNAAAATDIRALSFTDLQYGWAGGNQGLLLATRDGGASWAPQALPVAETVQSLLALDSLEALALVSSGDLYHTANGGDTWSFYAEGPSQLTTSDRGFLLDNMHAWIGYSADPSFHVARTTDGGLLWETTSLQNAFHVQDMTFRDTENGLLVGAQGRILHTTDGGITWTEPISHTVLSLAAVAWSSPAVCWAAGEFGALLRSEDNGVTWSQRQLPLAAHVADLAFADSLHGTLLADFGWMLTTEDGGETWAVEDTTVSLFYGTLTCPDAQHRWAGGWSGVIYRSVHPVAVEPQPHSLLPRDPLLAASPNPFNARTTLRFGSPVAGRVRLEIYDVTGRLVAVLADERLAAGAHARAWDGKGLASGLYFARLDTPHGSRTVKLALLR